MRLRDLLCAAALASAVLPAVPAAAATFSPTPDATIQTNGNVDAVVASADRVFFGGSFTRAGVPTPNGVDLALAGGAPNPAFAHPDLTVRAVVSDGAGGWYVGGDFTHVGALARNHLAHLLADGSVDPGFDPNLNDRVWALALSGGKLFVGGDFTTVNGGLARKALAVLDPTTGAATSFDAGIANGAPSVRALAVSGSTVYAGGIFTTVNGSVVRNDLAAFDATTATATAFDPRLDDNVSALALAGSTLYVGGNFTSLAGGATARRHLAAIDTATGLATSFDPNVDANVAALAVSGSTIYAAGGFTTVNGSVPRDHVAAFGAADGTVVASFDPDVAGNTAAVAVGGGTVYVGGGFGTVAGGTVARNAIAAFAAADGTVVAGFDPNVDGSVDALAVSGTRIYAGGSYDFIGADTVRNRVAAMRPDGSLDPTFDPDFGAANGVEVDALALSGPTLYAGGAFASVNGDSVVRHRLAAVDTTTGAATAFDPDVGDVVRALAVSGSTVYAGGDFTTVNGTSGVTRNRLAAFDASSGAVLAGFDPNVNASVRALVLAGGKLYAGGSFATINASTARNSLAALDPATGIADPAFNPNVGGEVFSLAASGTTLYAGGTFFLVNGSTTRTRLAAFDTATGVATAFDPVVDQVVRALAVTGATVYAGGDFANVNATGTTVSHGAVVPVGGVTRHGLAALDAATGVADPGFDPNVTGAVDALTSAGASLYAGGTFAQVGAARQRRIARFSEPVVTAAPAAVSGAASAIGDSTATLAGTVNPESTATTYVFEYGPTLSFGSISAPASAGSASADVPVSATLSGLSPNHTTYYRLVASSALGTTFGAVRSFTTTGAVPAPAAATLPATAVGDSSAVLNATVDPSGGATAFTFEIGPTTSFGAITPVVQLDAANAAEAVSATLSGLTPNTTYLYRVVATNATGTTVGVVRSFAIGPAAAPTATTSAATTVTATGATLAGSVDPHGSSTAFAFEYGPTTAFGSISAIDSAGSDPGPHSVALAVAGLAPGTTYLYRIVATNALGSVAGIVRSFTTPAA